MSITRLHASNATASGPPPLGRIIRGIDALVIAGVILLALHILIVLFTGGYRFRGLGIRLNGVHVSPALMLFLALLMLHFFLRSQCKLQQALASHKAFFLFSIVLIVYLANGKTLGAGDTLPARYLPLSVLRHGSFYLDEYLEPLTQNLSYLPFYLRQINGHYVSDFPVGAAVAALPFYAPIALSGVTPSSVYVADLEKLSAAVIVALSTVILYFVLCSLTSARFALAITAVYALGSSSLSASSQALWQHGPSQLALVAALYCVLLGGREHRWTSFAGLFLSLAIITRPTDLLLALPVGAYVIVHRRRHILGFALGGLPPIFFNLWYNSRYFGNPLRSQFSLLDKDMWSTPLRTGLAGILLSPSRGLFIYSPIFLLSVIGAMLAWRKKEEPLLRYLSIGVLFSLLLYSVHTVWWGGGTYGPRLLADFTPIFALFLCPLESWLARGRAPKVLFIVLAVWSIGAQSIGAFSDHWSWNLDGGIDWIPARRWSWTDNQLVYRPRGLLNSVIIAARHLPTSITQPALISASYRSDLPSVITIGAGQSIDFSVVATNRGQAVWLAWAKDEKGAVRLGWRWTKDNQKTPTIEWRVPLGHDLFPGQTYTFRTHIDSPREPGKYIFEVGLIDESIAGFSDLGTPVIRSEATLEPNP